jgi:hypothetical protein
MSKNRSWPNRFLHSEMREVLKALALGGRLVIAYLPSIGHYVVGWLPGFPSARAKRQSTLAMVRLGYLAEVPAPEEFMRFVFTHQDVLAEQVEYVLTAKGRAAVGEVIEE